MSVNEYLYEDHPYFPSRDEREVNAVARLKSLQNGIEDEASKKVYDDDVQEAELDLALERLESKIAAELVTKGYIKESQKGAPGGVAPLNDLGVVPDEYLPPSAGGQGIVALSLAGTLAEVTPEHMAIIPTTSETCAGLFSCEEKEKLASINPDIIGMPLEILPVSEYGFDTNLRINQQVEGSELIDKVLNATNVDKKQVIIKSGDYKYNVVSLVQPDIGNYKGFAIETMVINPAGSLDQKPAIEKCIFLYVPTLGKTCTFYEKDFTAKEITDTVTQLTVSITTKQDTISDLDTIRNGAAKGATAIQEHQDISGKLNVLPKVDDPTDPGFGWEYHIPYNFDAVPDAEKLNITLKTLTLDNKVTKMNFDKTLPGATTSTAGLMTAADKVALNNKQDKLTAGTNITIDANNVISATGGTSVSFDDKTIIKGSDNKYQTAIGGWKETTPEQSTNLFIDTKGNGSPTYIGPSSGSIKYEVGWDYNTTITSLVSGATTATIEAKFTVLGTTFNNHVTLTKSQSIPAIWESSNLTIGENVYIIKVYDGYLGTNQGGLGLVANDHSLDLSNSTMELCKLVTSPASAVYHPIDNKFLKLDSSLAVDENNKLKVNTDAVQVKLTAGDNVSIANNIISAIDTKVATSITIGKAITASQAVGGIAAGKTYTATDTLAQIIEDLLGGSGPTPTGTKLYYSVGSTVPTSVTGMTSVSTDAETLKTSGYTWKNITLNEEYPFLAIDKTLGIECYEILQNGFALGFNTIDLGDQILYYPDTKGKDTGVRLVYHFE